MLRQRNGRSLQSQLRPLSVLAFHLLLTHSVRGQSQLMGPSQPVVTTVGDDIILPCHLEPAVDVAAVTLEWTRRDLNPIFVLVWRAGQDYLYSKDPSYKGRTSLFTDELKRGNISLKLSDVRPSDAGRYRCFIPRLNIDSFVELVVGAVSSPVISLAGIDKTTSGVVLQCESAGWYPEPEVLWLDGEGKLLSAGPTETVRGPDDLYTVSSRVTVEKRHSNSFTCRVQQRNINQTRETHIQVPDDFFKVQSSYSIITGLAVGLAVCIVMFIVLLLLLLWKWRQNIIKTKRRYCGETDRGSKKNSSKTNKTEDQSVSDEESEQLMTTETVEMKIKKQRSQQQLLEEQQRREEAEKGVQTLKEELETKRKEVETKQCELQKLHEEKQRNEDELQTVKEELENKNKELETERQVLFFSPWKREEAEKEVETLTKQLETKQVELDTKIKKIDAKQAEVQQLQNQIQRVKSNLQTLMETLSKNMELEDKEQAAEMEWKKKYDMLMESKHEDIHMFKRHIDQLLADVKKLKEEKQTITNERQQLQKELERNKQAAERDLKEAQRQLKNKNTEINRRKKDLQHGEREVEKVERLMKELADRNIEWQKKLSDERIRREAAERQVEALKKELTTKPKTNESVSVQHGASSPTGPVTVPDINPLPNTSVL